MGARPPELDERSLPENHYREASVKGADVGSSGDLLVLDFKLRL